jgi:monoamine oxidase
MDRSTFLGAGAAALLARPKPGRLRSGPKVAIVGAGVAGLTCAYRLQQAGIASRVFEGNDRIGGRTWTLRDFFAEGQIAEHGGEFISLGQNEVQRLARELGLSLVNVDKHEPGRDLYYIDGAVYPLEAARADYRQHVYGPIHAAMRAAGYPTTYDRSTPAGRTLDQMSVSEWIAANVPGGLDSRIGKLLSVTCVQEYGGDATVQSALNLIYLLGSEKRGRLNLDGSIEALHIVGGNDQLATQMAAALPAGTVATGTALAALRELADGTYRCTFASAGTRFEVVADAVCLAIPFTLLRRVDTRNVPFSALKRRAIERLPMGTNAKLHMQFERRLWNEQHTDGSSYVDLLYENSWDVSAAQAGREGILVGYPGGRRGVLDAPAHGAAPAKLVGEYLSAFEHLYPGLSALWTGAAWLDVWAHDPWHFGSYSYYGVGDYTSFAGIEGTRERNVFFAGEQTSYEFQGYINGAVVSGERAARQIAAGL